MSSAELARYYLPRLVLPILLILAIYSVAPRGPGIRTSSAANYIDDTSTKANSSAAYISSTLGTWDSSNTSVGWLRLVKGSLPEVITQESHGKKSNPPPCPAMSGGASSNCVLWTARNTTFLSNGDHTTTGVASVTPLLDLVSKPALLHLRVTVQESLHAGRETDVLQFRATAPTMEGEPWYAFGFGGLRPYVLQRLFPANHTEGAALVSQFFLSTMNATASARLFAQTLAYQTSKTNQTTGGRASGGGAARYTFSPLCFWLAELHFSPGGDVSGDLWSTCGDRLTVQTSVTTYNTFLTCVNQLAVALIFLEGIPAFFGSIHQLLWIRNSRGRTLRVSSLQVLVVLMCVVFNSKVVAYAMRRAPEAQKALALLFTLNTAAQMPVLFLYLQLGVEELQNGNQEVMAARRLRRIMTAFCTLFLSSALTLVDYAVLASGWSVATVTILFWLPQWVHCFTMDGWAGLTAPFIFAGAALIIAPMAVAAIPPPAPWHATAPSVIPLICGICVIAVQSALLAVIRLTSARPLLPHWLNPWRHMYATTVEANREALAENAMCSICCNPLTEGWDESDELWQTPCHHLFHKSCLLRWMDERMECPLCRHLLPQP